MQTAYNHRGFRFVKGLVENQPELVETFLEQYEGYDPELFDFGNRPLTYIMLLSLTKDVRKGTSGKHADTIKLYQQNINYITRNAKGEQFRLLNDLRDELNKASKNPTDVFRKLNYMKVWNDTIAGYQDAIWAPVTYAVLREMGTRG